MEPINASHPMVQGAAKLRPQPVTIQIMDQDQ